MGIIERWLLLFGLFCVQEQADGAKENLARSGNATQSTTYNGQSADLTIDGGKDFSTSSSSCAATILGSQQWWRLDLQSVHKAINVVVTYREGSIPGTNGEITFFSGKPLEYFWDDRIKCTKISSNKAAITYSCGELEGRYITIFTWWGTISMCEVEVYETDHIRLSFMKLAFNSSYNLTDPTLTKKVLKELTSALAVRGITNVTLSWSQTPQEEDKSEAIPEADLWCD